MARIKIDDLPQDLKLSQDEMRKLTGGASWFQTVRFSKLIRSMEPGDDEISAHIGFTEPLD